MALVETPIYARIDGYIRQRSVEIGDRVTKGQLMMELDTPELDQQIVQARATLAQSQAALAQLAGQPPSGAEQSQAFHADGQPVSYPGRPGRHVQTG